MLTEQMKALKKLLLNHLLDITLMNNLSSVDNKLLALILIAIQLEEVNGNLARVQTTIVMEDG